MTFPFAYNFTTSAYIGDDRVEVEVEGKYEDENQYVIESITPDVTPYQWKKIQRIADEMYPGAVADAAASYADTLEDR